MAQQPQHPEPVNRAAGVEDINGYQLYGMDAELELKRREKRDPNRELSAMQWISSVLNEKQANFPESLRSGILLCRYVKFYLFCFGCFFVVVSFLCIFKSSFVFGFVFLSCVFFHFAFFCLFSFIIHVLNFHVDYSMPYILIK